MANYYLTNKAIDDLTQIWDYTSSKKGNLFLQNQFFSGEF